VSDHQDDILYSDLIGIKVMTDRCVVRGYSYLFADIISFKLKTIFPDRQLPLILIGTGLFLPILDIALIFLIAGTCTWFESQPQHCLVLETQEIKSEIIFKTKNLDDARELERFLDLALANYSNL